MLTLHMTTQAERLKLVRGSANALMDAYAYRDYQIQMARKEGVPVTKIAEAAGLTRRGVYFRLKALGVD